MGECDLDGANTIEKPGVVKVAWICELATSRGLNAPDVVFQIWMKAGEMHGGPP